MDKRQGVQEASSLDLRYLDPEEVRVWQGEDGRVYCTIADELTVLTPMFIRSHPLSDLERYLSIRGVEPKERSVTMGKEFGLLRNWRRIDPESRRLIEAELQRRYLHPKVTAIFSGLLIQGYFLGKVSKVFPFFQSRCYLLCIFIRPY